MHILSYLRYTITDMPEDDETQPNEYDPVKKRKRVGKFFYYDMILYTVICL